MRLVQGNLAIMRAHPFKIPFRLRRHCLSFISTTCRFGLNPLGAMRECKPPARCEGHQYQHLSLSSLRAQLFSLSLSAFKPDPNAVRPLFTISPPSFFSIFLRLKSNFGQTELKSTLSTSTLSFLKFPHLMTTV